jgi:hypothetical protein
LHDSRSDIQSLSRQHLDTDEFKNCSTESCPTRGLNPLKSTSVKDGAIHIIGYFCDGCKSQLEEIEKRCEQNNLYKKGVEYVIGF